MSEIPDQHTHLAMPFGVLKVGGCPVCEKHWPGECSPGCSGDVHAPTDEPVPSHKLLFDGTVVLDDAAVIPKWMR